MVSIDTKSFKCYMNRCTKVGVMISWPPFFTIVVSLVCNNYLD